MKVAFRKLAACIKCWGGLAFCCCVRLAGVGESADFLSKLKTLPFSSIPQTLTVGGFVIPVKMIYNSAHVQFYFPTAFILRLAAILSFFILPCCMFSRPIR